MVHSTTLPWFKVTGGSLNMPMPEGIPVRNNIGNFSEKVSNDGQEELPMHDWMSLSHVRLDCKHHVVFVPKYREKKLYGKFRNRVGEC